MTTPTPPAEPRKAPTHPPKSAIKLSPANLGERVAILFSITGDPEHSFSEVTGVLMKICAAETGARTYHIIRRSGEVVKVREDAVVRLKLIPAAAGPIRPPASWDASGS